MVQERMRELTAEQNPSASPAPMDPSSSDNSGEMQVSDNIPFEWEAQDWPDLDEPQEGEELFDIQPQEDINRDEFELLPQEPFHPQAHDQEEDEAGAGPGPHTLAARASHSSHHSYRALDDTDDTRFVVEHPSAGAVLQHNPQPPPPTRPQDSDGDITMDGDTTARSAFFPFNSELDWKVAEWAIKDGPGHKAVDRFLSIPGVSHLEILFCWHRNLFI